MKKIILFLALMLSSVTLGHAQSSRCMPIAAAKEMLKTQGAKIVFYAQGANGINMLLINKNRSWGMVVIPNKNPSIMCSIDQGEEYEFDMSFSEES